MRDARRASRDNPALSAARWTACQFEASLPPDVDWTSSGLSSESAIPLSVAVRPSTMRLKATALPSGENLLVSRLAPAEAVC